MKDIYEFWVKKGSFMSSQIIFLGLERIVFLVFGSGPLFFGVIHEKGSVF